MHPKIKENLSNAFQALNNELTEAQLVNVLAAIVKIIEGKPYIAVLDDLYKSFPYTSTFYHRTP